MTYPNLLTVLRMAVVPVFVILVVYGFGRAALAVFIAAGLTDVLDGYIARQFGQNSELGEVLDPVADKLLIVSSFIVLTIQSDAFEFAIPLWLTITTIGRDLLLVVSGLIITLTIGKTSFPPTSAGKATTFFQLMTVLTVLASSILPGLESFFRVIVILALVTTIGSGLHYSIRGVRTIAQSSGQRDSGLSSNRRSSIPK